MSRKLFESLNLITPLGNTGFSHGSPTTTRGTLRIAETFQSRQGEGKLTGTDSFFIRTSGCNLRCWFCDTPYASWNPKGEQTTFDQILTLVQATGLRHVVLTGGEPMLSTDSTALCQRLQSEGFHLTVETAGTIDRQTPCDLLSISPKFKSSTPDAIQHPKWSKLHAERRMPIDTMRRLIDSAPDYQIKFVVDSPEDYDELLEITEQLTVPADSVWVMPQGSTNEAMDAAAKWLKKWVEKEGFRYCDRMQIRWY
ncbi:7-carboxy-7-deazaguanine synthase QueE, partial [Rhodopirellula sp.]|nr:7-carboxy-7-deazaguanine synthase QueE [Rhodopirellula sp.]